MKNKLQGLGQALQKNELNDQSYQEVHSNYFNSFMFVDQITQNSVFVQDLQNTYKKARRDKQANISGPKSTPTSKNISECLKMMKLARKFQISSLQQKNYGIKSHNNSILKQNQGQSKNQKAANKLKKIVQERKRREQLKYKHDKQNLKKVLQSQQSVSIIVNERQLEDTEEIHLKEKKLLTPLKQIKQNRKIVKEIEKVDKKQGKEEQFLNNIYNHIHYEVKKDSEFLIAPKKNKLFIINRRPSKERNTTKQSYLYESGIKSLNFSTEKEETLFSKFHLLQKENQSTLNCNSFKQQRYQNETLPLKCLINEKQKNLIRSITEGNYFKIQIQLSLSPQLLNTVDEKHNNLLHLCILSNNDQIFQMILQKSWDAGLNLVNKPNKYKRTPLELAKIFGFFVKKPALLEKINRHISFHLMRKLSAKWLLNDFILQ